MFVFDIILDDLALHGWRLSSLTANRIEFKVVPTCKNPSYSVTHHSERTFQYRRNWNARWKLKNDKPSTQIGFFLTDTEVNAGASSSSSASRTPSNQSRKSTSVFELLLYGWL